MSIVRSVSAVLAAVALAATPVILSASDQVITPKDDAKVVGPAPAKSASSAQFAALKGVKAVPMSTRELKAVKGQHVHFLDGNGGFHLAGNPENSGVGTGNWYDNGTAVPVAPSYHGLCVAAGQGSITIPLFGGPAQCP